VIKKADTSTEYENAPLIAPLLAAYPNARFSEVLPLVRHLIVPVLKNLKAGVIEYIVWFMPFYLKTYQPVPLRSEMTSKKEIS
jgi:hypothetical protein